MRYLFLIYITLYCLNTKAQTNLVPNYSFEQYNACPNSTPGNIQHCFGWYNANTNGSADYYNACVTTAPYYFWVPKNFPGYQSTRTGNGYAGIIVFGGPNFTSALEYTQTKLRAPLKPNYQYCVQYFVSRADSMGDYGISNFGALFTNTVVNSSDPYNIQMSPQIKNPAGRFIMNKQGWSSISGTFMAAGGEEYITIGNFDSYLLVDTLYDPVHPSNPQGIYDGIYYYIDDVIVEEVSNAQAGADKIINCGDSIVLGADSAIGAYYKWTPAVGLSNDSIAFPVANPTITTTYVVKKQQCSIITYDTVKVTVNSNCQVIGIKELALRDAFKIYPNPAREHITIEANLKRSDQAVITIYNIMGEIVLSEKITSGKTAVNTSSLNNGTYLYRIVIDGDIAKADKLIIIK